MLMYAIKAKSALKVIATMGNPFLVANLNILGALPDNARLWSARDEEYRSDVDADQAEVRIAALMTAGKPLIPAFLMAITKGDRAAVELPRSKSGLLDGTMSPITNAPPM